LKESPIRPRMRWKLEEASRWTSERAWIDLHSEKRRPRLHTLQTQMLLPTPYGLNECVTDRHNAQWCPECCLPPLRWRTCCNSFRYFFFLMYPLCRDPHINKLA
jgi:hypothetical protein